MAQLKTVDLSNGLTAELRPAVTGDVHTIVALLADDPLGRTRDGIVDGESLEPYLTAFATIDADPAHQVVVATVGGVVVGTLQLSILPGLARRGASRAQIEAVRVAEDYRSAGLGAAMITWAIEEAERRKCALVQLTTDKSRADAHRFYARLGFTASHEGFKLAL